METKNADRNILSDIETLKDLKFQAACLDAQIEEYETRLKDYAGESETVYHQGVAVYTYKTVQTNRLDTVKLKTEMPEVYGKYLKTSTGRRLRVI